MNDINRICSKLSNSEIVILPSDTLYGIAANAYDKIAVEKVFAIKQRPDTKKLPIHYSSLEQASKDIIINDVIKKLAKKFMPGALTIIANQKSDSKLLIDGTVGFRIPKHNTLLEIIRKLNIPITMPSANIHNQAPLMEFAKIQEILKLDGIEDDSSICKIPSTIVDATGKNISLIREGAISFHEIQLVLNN